MPSRSFGIHWFRRDLRIDGNPALTHNWKIHEGRVLGIFCFDARFLKRQDFSHNRFGFFLKSLAHLQKEMRSRGGNLLVLDALPAEAFSQLVSACREKPGLISWNRDYEPFARERDEKVEKIWAKLGVPIFTARDHLVFEPHEILKDDGTSYQVYTPFSRQWLKRASITSEKQRWSLPKEIGDFQIQWKTVLKSSMKDFLVEFQSENQKYETVSLPEAGATAAQEYLRTFKSKVAVYANDRDLPFKDGTSKLSMFLKNGSLTTAEVISYLKLDPVKMVAGSSEEKFLKELIWREFFYSILWHHPRVEKEAFVEKYKNIKWKNNEKWFARWCEGTTGYPIVDAGMRQLNTTGWMHNRVRMIVASFLCKDLLIDWRWGERYFMNKLLDGDLACNNGGWQWAASTGCDAQPYFRIFNPYLQSKKFDPEGQYIRSYVKELAHIKDASIHCPENVKGYPTPLVGHEAQKKQALFLYKNL